MLKKESACNLRSKDQMELRIELELHNQGIKGDGKSRRLIIKDKQGKLIFDGPITTDEEKAAIPEKYRDRLEELEGMVNIEFEADLP